MPRLTIQETGEPVAYDILDAEVTIGRGASNDIQLAAAGVSKHHAVLRRTRGRVKLVDLESLNGTLVNGRYLNQRWLRNGDSIRIGDATLVFDADGAEEGPPVQVAVRPKVVPAKAAPAAVKPTPVTPAVPMKPRVPAASAATPARPVAARPAAVAPPRPAPSPVRAAAPAPVRRRSDDLPPDDEGEERRPGRRPPKKDNTAWMVVGAIAGALVLAYLAFSFLGATRSGNRQVLHHGIDLARAGKFEEALRVAETEGERGGADYDILADEMLVWRDAVESRKNSAIEDESQRFWNEQIVFRSRSPTFKAVNPMTPEQTVQRIHEWLDKYPGTRAVYAFAALDEKTMEFFRQLLREHPDPEYVPSRVTESLEPVIDALRKERRYHTAIQKLNDVKAVAPLRMTPENWRTFEAQLRRWEQDIRDIARPEIPGEMARAKALVDAGDRANAERKLKSILRRYPRDMVPDAMPMLDDLMGVKRVE